MTSKGTWQHAEPSSSSSSNDRRYGSSQYFNNHMSMSGMSYASNNSSMFNTMNSSSTMMSSSNNHSNGNKPMPYRGTVSNIFRDFGVIDNEISFKLSSINGPLPRVGDSVLCQRKQVEGYGNQTPYKHYGFDVRIVDSHSDGRRNRPTSNVKRSVPSSHNGNNHHDDNNRSSPSRRTPKNVPPKRSSRPPISKYMCLLPKGNLDCSELNVVQIRTRYPRLHIPSDFYHASFTWHQSIPLDHPLRFVTPCSFHVFNKSMKRVINQNESSAEPTDIDYSWSVRVLLMASPDIQTLISRSCLLNNDPNKRNSIDPDDFEHPSKLIKFLVGLRNQNEYIPLGGCWSSALDGPNPDKDPQVLIRTAIRCVLNQTGIDLSECIQWFRFLEVRYHRPEEIHKGRLIESRVENVVVLLPEIGSSCMPTSLEWEETIAKYKEACEQEIAEELNEIVCSDEDLQDVTATHHSNIEIDRLESMDLRRELTARNIGISGIKSDLKRRLSKALEQEKARDNGETTNNSTKIEVKDSSSSDVEKLRKEIESKYEIPSQRSILVHPTKSRLEKMDCRVVSLHYLLNYANKDTIKEKCFELYLFMESFFEMLQRDYSYRIYRCLFSCLELTETKVTENPTEEEPMNTENVDQQENDDENGKKRKRSTSKDENLTQRKKSTQQETEIRTIHHDLLLAFTFFDRNRFGYLAEKDLEEILLLSGLSLTKNEVGFYSFSHRPKLKEPGQTVKLLVSRVSQDEKVRYHKLTDKTVNVDEINESDSTSFGQSEIDQRAPKGNLLFLPKIFRSFYVGENSKEETNNSTQIYDHQRAMKQVEVSTQIQTALELKIEALKKEIQTLNDELSSTQKASRSYSEQLNETKKRLRDSQHELRELEEKSKKFFDGLNRVRRDSRSTYDYLNHLLAIPDKQTRKSEDESKKKKDENPPENETTIEVSEPTAPEQNDEAKLVNLDS